MRDDQTRVLVSDWKTIKQFIPVDPQAEEQGLTPRFGWVTDNLRIKYGIYVEARPVTNSELSQEGPSQAVYGFKGTAIYLKDSIVYKNFTISKSTYFAAIREAINKAIEWVK